MIHPSTTLKPVNDSIGLGVYATAFIPRGTIVYVRDKLEVVIDPDSPLLRSKQYRGIIDKYTYISPDGKRILSWDTAKYVNHSCEPNTMSSGYDFEIAVRDIQPGDEITDEYGLFNLSGAFSCSCGSPNCRQRVNGTDINTHYHEWDEKIKSALGQLNKVDQPLLRFLDRKTGADLKEFLRTGKNYRSVYSLKMNRRRSRQAS